MTTTKIDLSNPICTICSGNGFTNRSEFTKFTVAGPDNQGAHIPAGEYGYAPPRDITCVWCKGSGHFPSFDKASIDAIMKEITVSRGRNKGTLKASRPKYANNPAAKRAYYVWRLARFHGGKDCCLPMAAEMDVRGDGAKEALDEMSKIVAKAAFGTARAGTSRWNAAMTGDRDPFDPLTMLMHGTNAASVDATEELGLVIDQ